MRIAVWNLERGGRHAAAREQQAALLSSIPFDLAILTEPPAEPALVGGDISTSPPLRAGHAELQPWVAIVGAHVTPVRPALPYERLAVAARAVVDDIPVVVYGSVLPWRSAPRHAPDLALPGESASAMFACYLDRQAADVEELQRTNPDTVILWAGDFNQSLEGPNYVGSAKGRTLLEGALERLGLVAWNRAARHAKEELCAIDLVCGPGRARCGGVERIDPSPGGQRLSDHTGYVVEVDLP